MKKVLFFMLFVFMFASSKADINIGGVHLESCFLYDATTGKVTLRDRHGYPNSFGAYFNNPYTTWAYVINGASTYGPFIVTAIVPIPIGTRILILKRIMT